MSESGVRSGVEREVVRSDSGEWCEEGRGSGVRMR